jgi:hypothetical protein
MPASTLVLDALMKRSPATRLGPRGTFEGGSMTDDDIDAQSRGKSRVARRRLHPIGRRAGAWLGTTTRTGRTKQRQPVG